MSAPTKMLRIKTEVKTIIIISSLRVGVWFLRKPRLSEGGQSRVLMLNNFPYMSVGERYLRVPRTTLRRGSRGEMLYTNNAPERLMVEDEIVESYNQLFLFSYFILSTDEKSTEVINSDNWCVFQAAEPVLSRMNVSPMSTCYRDNVWRTWMLSSPRSRSGSPPSTLLALIQLKNISEDNRREGWLPNYSLCLMSSLTCSIIWTSSRRSPRCSSRTRTEGGATLG